MEVRDNPEAQQFELTDGGALIGVAQYRHRPGVTAFIHTEIEPGHEGEGLGGMLVKSALESVRQRGEDVLPFCPFVNKYIAEHDEFLPLVPTNMREKFSLSTD
jgi:predicted GNAT family acetyltransferase